MKKTILTCSLLAFALSCFAQEALHAGINQNKFGGVIHGGEMEQYMYIPTFINLGDEKRNFSITHISVHGLTDDQKILLELPNTYSLQTSSFNMENHFLIFYDEKENKDVFITLEGENVVKKKVVKHTGNKYIAVTTNSSDGFTFVTINKKGNYTVTLTDKNLEDKWEKTFSAPSGTTWDIINVRSEMDGIVILRKENKSGNKYAFTQHGLDPMEGNEMFLNTISKEGLNAYPTFFTTKEGMTFTGGYYYNNGTYDGKPHGVFFAVLSPDYNIEQSATVPYSQVIEDIKSTSGDKLTNSNSSIAFIDGYMSHETESFVMIGQVFSRKNNENGADITIGEIITVEFSLDEKYKNAAASKIEESTITLKGSLSTVNNLDLGTWMNYAGLFTYSHPMPSPGYPLIAYKTMNKNQPLKLCYKTIGLKQDTAKTICDDMTRMDYISKAYNFNGIKSPSYPVKTSGIILEPMNPMGITIYELNKSELMLHKMNISTNLEDIMVERLPMEENIDEEVIEDVEPQNEEGE